MKKPDFTPVPRDKDLHDLETDIRELRFRLRDRAIIGGPMAELDFYLISIQQERLGSKILDINSVRRRLKELKPSGI